MGITLRGSNAGIAQLVEHDLAKVGVASSSLVSRSSHATRGARGSWVAEGVGRRCAHGFGRVKSIHGQTRSGTIRHANAGIAQLVEHDLAKVGVASSSLVSRSSHATRGARGSWVAEGVGRRCAHGFGRVKSIHGQTRSGTIRHANAGIAQLVEHDLAKVGVASSSLVSRSSS